MVVRAGWVVAARYFRRHTLHVAWQISIGRWYSGWGNYLSIQLLPGYRRTRDWAVVDCLRAIQRAVPR